MANKFTITISRIKLINIIKENRERHIQFYNEAVEGFQDELKRMLNQALGNVPKYASAKKDVNIYLAYPEHHIKEYDVAIAMLELSEDQTLVLDEQQFANFVQDNWTWSYSFRSKAISLSENARVFYAHQQTGFDEIE